ncbi:hypothetical protein [Paenibacillus sp. YAF4_2]|uniref:hypothetical protein n=1 Tax=Paenibacillus sp. YAF4_2 TaxID=3233085 RepID=UPI003F99499E
MLFKVEPGTQRSVTADESWSTGIFYVAISTVNSVALTGDLSVNNYKKSSIIIIEKTATDYLPAAVRVWFGIIEF